MDYYNSILFFERIFQVIIFSICMTMSISERNALGFGGYLCALITVCDLIAVGH